MQPSFHLLVPPITVRFSVKTNYIFALYVVLRQQAYLDNASVELKNLEPYMCSPMTSYYTVLSLFNYIGTYIPMSLINSFVRSLCKKSCLKMKVQKFGVASGKTLPLLPVLPEGHLLGFFG